MLLKRAGESGGAMFNDTFGEVRFEVDSCGQTNVPD